MFTNRNRSFSKALQQGTAMTLISMMALSGVAVAQDAIVSSSQAGAPVAATADEDIQEVVVVGARAAQQSANDRKKRAKTAMDSIVADDVGAFPDRNLNEAISRVAGAALGRDDYGEGGSITLRGNSMENIRIEMDGLGVGGGGIDVTRSADLTSLPADLIKSVDVVKGSAADMTEGGLGGSVRIQTRTGLDFAKPYFQLRIGGRHNSLGQQWQPEYNLVASRKFFDNRLGVLLNVSGSQFQKNTNGAENNQYLAGYQGRVDFDNSPEKTFSFNPATVASPDGENRATFGADTLLANSTFTPRQIVEASAAAESKAECYAAFPLLTPGTGVNQSNTAARRNQRVYELQTCLGQWNDLEPQLPRNFDHSEYEDRFSADLRFDFRVNDNLTIFAKYNMIDRKVDRYFRERRLGGGLSTAANPGAIYNATSNPMGVWTNTTGGTYQQRGVAPGNTNYFYYDGVGVLNNLPIIGDVLPIDPASVQVDENHFVTEYTMNDQGMFIGQRHEPYSFETSFVQAGGQYKSENLNVEFMAGKSSTDYTRINTYTNRSFNYGSARFYVQPSGMWAYDILNAYDETDPANFVQMIPQAALPEQIGAVDVPYSRPYSVTERPLVSRSNIAVEYDPYLSETQETTAKIDATYNFEGKIPFFTSLKVGVNYRNPEGSFWSRTGGRTISSARGTYYLMNGNNPVRDTNGMPVRNPDYVAPVVLPRSFLRSTIRACEPTATSIESCNYGYAPFTSLFQRRDNLLTVTPEEMRNIIGSTIRQPDSNFFNDFEGAEALNNWQGIDTAAIVALMPNTDLSCVKSCVASDGNVYDQPYRKYSEKITAAYYMVEFEQELPFNLLFNGNVGLRMVETEATGTGDFTLEYVRTTQAFNEADYNNANGIQRYTYSRIVDFTKTTRDWLPSYNLNLWVVPDQLVLRYYKGKNVARPSIGDILPVGTCTIDERRELGVDELGEDNTCGRIGNPALKPFTAWNQNLSVEWYPNRDTMISLARFIQDERIGRRIGITQSMNLLEGQGLVDEVTGESLDNMVFSVPTWGNAPGFKKEGWELTTKTAFTFLPWRLRYTGADFNYSKIESNPIGGASSFIVDPNTGDVMPPQGESKYYANLSLWYDDGKTNARISWQARDELFVNIEGNSGNVRNNYPFPGGTNSRPTPYRPGNPVFESKTLYVDAKISHKLTPSVEAFVEARNITKEYREFTNGGGLSFADGTPYVNGLNYGGRHFMFGLTYKMQ